MLELLGFKRYVPHLGEFAMLFFLGILDTRLGYEIMCTSRIEINMSTLHYEDWGMTLEDNLCFIKAFAMLSDFVYKDGYWFRLQMFEMAINHKETLQCYSITV